MALKITPPRERRLQMAKAWIPTYTGKNILKGYRKHFALSPLGAVADLQLMGYEFTLEYIEQLKRDEVNRSNLKRKQKEKSLEFLEYDEFNDDEVDELYRISIDDGYEIAEWFYIECDNFYKDNNKLPSSKSEIETSVDLVYERIQGRDIWIPFGEIKQYFTNRKTRIEKRVLKRPENV